MKINYQQFYLTAAIILCFFFLFKWINASSSQGKITDLYEHRIQKEKNFRDSIIVVYKRDVERSKLRLIMLESEKNDLFLQMDSLQRLKQKVKVIYVEKRIEVNNFTTSELENYWKQKLAQ